MTDQEINIAIAVACGWKRRQDCDYLSKSFSGNFEKQELWELNGRVTHLPDYCHDLNAMHEAEEHFESAMCGQFEDELHKLLLEDWRKGTARGGLWPIWHATALQRAEAFLRVKGLWKE